MITSDQIHEKEFSFKLRGYNDAEVDAYLAAARERLLRGLEGNDGIRLG